MKLRRMFVFSAVIVSLTLVALAAPELRTFDLKFKGEGQFGYYFKVIGGDLVMVFCPAVLVAPTDPPAPLPHVPDSLNVSHLGLSEVDWEIGVTAENFEDPSTYVFHSGWFTINGANGKNSLEGDYSDWVLDATSGDYTLDWDFTGGFSLCIGHRHNDQLSRSLVYS